MLQDIISLLGIANPQLSLTWQDGGSLPTESEDVPMRLLGNASGEWLAPAAGLLNKNFAKRLTMPDGNLPAASSWVIAIYPQIWLRLSRLYGAVLEGRSSQTDRVQRPVPRYFAFHDTNNIGSGPAAGTVSPGMRLQLAGGNMSVHDDSGRPIDTLATACAFAVLMTRFPALIFKAFSVVTLPSVTSSQLGRLVASLGSSTPVRVRLISFFGKPFVEGVTKLTNLSAINADSGVYQLNDPVQQIQAVSPPASPSERIALGPATFGSVANAFSQQALGPSAPLATLKRDFLTLFVDDLNSHLRGKETLSAPFAGLDFVIPTYHNETLALLINGNQVTAQAGQILSEADNLSFVVSPVINSDFEIASSAALSEWPIFPPGGDGKVAGKLENPVIRAHFLASPADTRDVFLMMQIPATTNGEPQLAAGTAVRIFNRKFLADAREGRGNGAGGILDINHSAGFLLVNPFGLRPNEALPQNPMLSFDLIAVNRSGSKRAFGLLGTKVEAPRTMDASELALADRGTNSFNSAQERGISPAGLVGLPSPRLNTIPSNLGELTSVVNVALGLADESQPRVAPRLPTMTRNETIISGRDSTGNWSSLLSGLWLRRDSRSSFHRFGSPGSPGGEEFLGTGIFTSGGTLAYDLARTALRRTRGLASRLTMLDNEQRLRPPTGAEPNGTFSVALLQNISPISDSPNLRLILDNVFDQLPTNWAGLVNEVDDIIPSGLAANQQLRNAITSLAGSSQGNLLYGEFRREAVTARYGRRDALPVLTAALKSARDLIYIESSAFSCTDYLAENPTNPQNADDPPNPESDLVTLIARRMAEEPGLKVLIGVSKEFPTGIGYESFAARAYDRRKKALAVLQAVDPSRVTLFHPIGFPGRPMRLMHTVIIVDDMWLYVGSGSFTRRGLLFDGNLSMVCFDSQIEAGRSKGIRNFRRQLLENLIGTRSLPGSPLPSFPHPNQTRIGDLHEAYFAVRDMLDQGGSGMIEGVWDGSVTGQTPIPATSFPHRDLADPVGTNFPSTFALLLPLFVGLGEAEA